MDKIWIMLRNMSVTFMMLTCIGTLTMAAITNDACTDAVTTQTVNNVVVELEFPPNLEGEMIQFGKLYVHRMEFSPEDPLTIIWVLIDSIALDDLVIGPGGLVNIEFTVEASSIEIYAEASLDTDWFGEGRTKCADVGGDGKVNIKLTERSIPGIE